MSVASIPSQLLTRVQAAEFLGVKEQTLGAWASLGRYNLPQIKVGRLSKYKLSDLEKFCAERSTTTTELDD